LLPTHCSRLLLLFLLSSFGISPSFIFTYFLVTFSLLSVTYLYLLTFVSFVVNLPALFFLLLVRSFSSLFFFILCSLAIHYWIEDIPIYSLVGIFTSFFRCFQPPSLYSCLSWLSVFISFWLLFFSYHTLLASRLAYSFWNSFLFFAGTLISMLFYLIFLKPLFLSYCHMFFLLFLRFIVVTSGFRVLMLSGDLLIFFVTAILRLACFLYTLTYFSFFFFFYIFILISYFIFL